MSKQLIMEGYITDENEDDSVNESVVDDEKNEKSVNMFMVPNDITMSSNVVFANIMAN